MPPTLKVVVAHRVGAGLSKEDPRDSRGGTFMCSGAMATKRNWAMSGGLLVKE